MSKGSRRRPSVVDERIEAARWEIFLAGWKPMEYDPPGQPYEIKRFGALPDSEQKLYWRPVEAIKESK
jgi:hypothetical protein